MALKCSFDFDGTLEYKSIHEYAKTLIVKGIDVWIVTSRFESAEKCNAFFGTTYTTDVVNKELFRIAEEVGVPKEKIVFTNMLSKWIYFENHPEFIWHLDDDWEENTQILKHTKVKAISAFGNPNWKQKCERVLRKAMINKIKDGEHRTINTEDS